MFRRRMYRRAVRRARVPRTVMPDLSLVRVTQPQSLSIGATAGIASGSRDFQLNDVVTSDIQSIFRFFKLDRVVARFSYNQDPANNAALGGGVLPVLQIICSNDPEGVSAPTPSGAYSLIAAYANHKSGQLTADRQFQYSFRPRVRAVNDGNTLPSSQSNEWLFCSATGCGIPHCRLLYCIQSSTSAQITSTIVATVTYEFHFRVRGIA